jgi:hypothetical protein
MFFLSLGGLFFYNALTQLQHLRKKCGATAANTITASWIQPSDGEQFSCIFHWKPVV